MEISKEQFDDIRNFTRSLTQKRMQMSDGQLLDLCQQHLDALIEHLAADFEEHPHINDEEAAPEPEPMHIGHSGQGPKLESSIDPPVTPPPPTPEPPPPAPVHSEPKREVRHTIAHKRPTPRKTHR
jgi:hypothetical protein